MKTPGGDRYGAFLLYCNDWLSSTAISLMTAGEERGYLRLLLHAWKAEDCGLPDDDDVLAQLSKLGRAWSKNGKSGAVLRAQFVARDGRLYNERLLREREHQKAVRFSRSSAAKTAADVRWNASRIADGMRQNAKSKSSSLNTKTDLDCAPTNRTKRDSSPRVIDAPSRIKQFPQLKEVLRRYFREPGQEDLVPSGRLVADVMDAAGASEEEVIGALKYLYEVRGLKPGTRNGPRHWSWFKAVVADYFTQKRAREDSANPCGFAEWEARNDYRLDQAQFDTMLEAIELPDRPTASQPRSQPQVEERELRCS